MPPISSLTISPPRDDAELERMAPLVSHALLFPLDRAMPYYEAVGKANVRIARFGEDLAAGLVLIPMGQFWGGRSVPMTGIGAVGVAPEYRSRGVGVQLLRAAMQELHDTGCPLSVLYPATQPIYRKVGFEVAGASCEIVVPTDSISIREPSVDVRPITPDDVPRVRELYRNWAAENSGNLDRTPFMWQRVEEVRGIKRRGYLLIGGPEVEGYFYYSQKDPAGARNTMEFGDYVCTSGSAARRLLQFIADHRSMIAEASWVGSPLDPLLLLLREQSRKITARSSWMLRIVRVADALSLRGYPACLDAEVDLRIHDDLLPQNAGEYRLTVREGRGSIMRGGSGTCAMDIRALAALYSGSVTAAQLAALGLLRGPATQHATLSAIFAGPIPWMRDGF